MKKIHKTVLHKILYNLCMILCIQVCLSLLSAILEIFLWDGLLNFGDCGIGFLALGVIFLLMAAVPILLYLAASKLLVYPDGVRYTLLCALSVPMLILLVGICLTKSPDLRLQNGYYFLNPFVHNYEYVLEFTGIPKKELLIPALCLAQLTEAVLLTIGMRRGNAVSKQAEPMDKGE